MKTIHFLSEEATRKAFENDPCQKITRQAQKKNTSVSTVSRIVKKTGGKSLRCSKKLLLWDSNSSETPGVENLFLE